jgi:hypothetical protein
MENFDINENDKKIDLIIQIHNYEIKGFKVKKNISITDSIGELEYYLSILKNEERNLHIEKELEFYKLIHIIFGKQIPPKEKLLKFCYGTKEYFEYHKQK